MAVEVAERLGAAANASAPILACHDLTKRFNRGMAEERIALNGLSLELAPRDFVVIIGSNGAGKSTLLNMIGGDIQPDSGTIVLDGDDLTRVAAFRRAGSIARVFQDPMKGTAAAMTIEENLALAEQRGKTRTFARHVSPAARERYRALLAPLSLGLENRLSTQVAHLSGGQRQALSLVMASVSQPKLLLLDEHTAALDPRTADIVMAATLEIIDRHALTAMMVTHNMRQAIETGNRLIMMDAGRIRYDIGGDAKSALTQNDLVEKFRIDNDRMLLGT
jgi:putative ABC transport system ATP-binding protein